MNITIIITRPKPAYHRQSITGVSLCASGAQFVMIFRDKHTRHHDIYVTRIIITNMINIETMIIITTTIITTSSSERQSSPSSDHSRHHLDHNPPCRAVEANADRRPDRQPASLQNSNCDKQGAKMTIWRWRRLWGLQNDIIILTSSDSLKHITYFSICQMYIRLTWIGKIELKQGIDFCEAK